MTDADPRTGSSAAGTASGTDRAVSAIRLLQDRARTSNLVRVSRLRDVLDRLDAGSLTDAEREDARDLAHKVVGSAGTFGYPEVSSVAGRLEDFFIGGRFTDGNRAAARTWLSEIETMLAVEPDADDDWD